LARLAKLVSVLLVIACAAGILIWVTRPGPAPPPAVSLRGGTAVSSIRSEPQTFNRLVGRDSVTDTIACLTQAKLVRINRVTQELEPWLAESWTLSADGLTYTIKLRHGLTFSDREPFTSADVVFTFQAVYDPKVGSALAESLRVGGKPLQVSAPDQDTVVITFPSPFGPGLRLLDNVPILPRHRLEPALQQGTLAEAWGVRTPPSEMTGLGPFVLAEYQAGQRLVFHRNPYYWRTDASGIRLPYLERLTLEIVPDQNAEVLRLQTGQTDFGQSEIRAEDYAALKRAADDGRVTLVDLGVGLDPDSLWFNLNPKSKGADPKRPWLQQVELRRAISHAVDRRAFADAVFLGAAVPVDGPITPGNRRWYDPDLPTYPFDRAAATRLLAGIGLADRDGDGTLEDKRGTPARFTLITQKGNTALERGAQFLREDLRKIGLVMDVVPIDFGALVTRLEQGDYEAIYFRFLTTDLDPALNLDLWLSSGGAHVWFPSQPRPATDWERQIDELMAQQVAALDETKRKALFAEVQRIFANELPIIHFAAPRVYVALSTRILNATPALLRPTILWNPDTLAVKRPGGAGN
jgi:peptide/nickel transport system substrate-binding protein